MKHLDLFSGIGGFALALEQAGFETVAFCEIDKYCRKILKQHWPDTTIHEDIKELDGKEYAGTIDIITGGYPCQPFSVAGKQRAEEDERHLWPEMLRIIRDVRPRWVVAENVAGHIKLGFDTVAAQMEAEGYTVWPFVIPACAVGAPHRRDRVWIIAHSYNSGNRASESRINKKWQEKIKEWECQPFLEFSRYCEVMANPQIQRIQRDWATGKQELSSHAKERLFSSQSAGSTADNWEAEPRVGRMANGIPDRVDRTKALGNAIVPQIATCIGLAIMNYEGKCLV